MHPGNTDAGYSYLSPGRLNLVKHPFVNAHKRPKNTHTGTLAEDLIDFILILPNAALKVSINC